MSFFVSGFLGLCSAAGAGAATEIAAAGYNRQPVQFSTPQAGVSVNVRPWTFGPVAGITSTAGRAIFDAPVGGNLLLVLPHAAPRLPMAPGALDLGDDGDISLNIAALADYGDGSAFNGGFGAAAVLGICYDVAEIIGLNTTQPNPVDGVTVLPQRGQFLLVQASPLTAGVGLVVSRGLLQAAT
jgi:hypothetical protein